MSRSKWKGPYIDKKTLLKNLNQTKSRNSIILPSFINSEMLIHNGHTVSKLVILEEMIGHKFGELISTRKSFSFKKNK
nr:ribosomal protein S19 [Lithodesmioides sp. mgcode 4]